ncbi:MAG TPA: glycosyltransferase family 2 protein [Desulfobacterales bacterium]|nr:glycosyltransferase family 2 protein [Desulfobacterales bacterium]HIP38203.1 glycosyltransferase family 2 protein [Desulfocapsa sulfexigens]
MQISAIILTWNSQHHIQKCLTSLLASLGSEFKSYEIFVIDNGSEDESKRIIEEFAGIHPKVIKPLFLDTNKGTTYSRNLAIKQATGDFIAILDSDVVIPGNKRIFGNLLDSLNDSSQVGMVVPRLVYGNGDFQKSTDDFPTLFSKFRRYFLLKTIEQDEGRSTDFDNRLVDYAISAFWLLKKELITNIGLLDEKIFYAPEDVDYCLRIWKGGYKIIYVPSCEVVHDAQEISRGFRLNKAFRAHLKGLFYYFFKHRYWCNKPRFL